MLRDAGTYSYNCEAPLQEYFPSVAAHNSIQFYNHDQMPRLTLSCWGNGLSHGLLSMKMQDRPQQGSKTGRDAGINVQ